jgi:hypothetical protein
MKESVMTNPVELMLQLHDFTLLARGDVAWVMSVPVGALLLVLAWKLLMR